MKKSDVNGDETNEVYKWLKTEKAGLFGLTRIKVGFIFMVYLQRILALRSMIGLHLSNTAFLHLAYALC